MRYLRNLVLFMVPILILLSLHGSSSRWRALQEELERREGVHATEVERLEQRIAKAQQAQAKCGADNKDSMEKEKQRYIQRLAKQDAELRLRDDKFKKAEARVKELEKEESSSSRERERLQKLADTTSQGLAMKEEELQDLKDESISALKASRDRAGVLRRGLQGSAALLAEKNVLIEQLNVTLIQALYHMEPDQRTSAAQAVGNLNLPLKERKATAARLSSSDLDLESALEQAVATYQSARQEHARLAQEFVNTTRREKERAQKEREAEAAREKEKLAQKERREQRDKADPSLAAMESMAQEAAAAAQKAVGSAKEKLDKKKSSLKGGPVADPLTVAKAIKPLDLMDEQKQFKEKRKAEMKNQIEEEGDVEGDENIGDLEWSGAEEESPDQKKTREEQEAARRKRVERAMHKEETRQEQAKYWAKYHDKKKRKRAAESGDGDGAAGVDDADVSADEEGDGNDHPDQNSDEHIEDAHVAETAEDQ
eukprot:CAMPEP_0114257532 /NCGR_PEP_ID=MMETSP0058-20121206/18788_1 /TAXON_ID=36894 /ORGANISM="Pyramimonas parkeae, CCMP726" /LENGTH=484 /DNA_ID=CAMNT_0001372275 /DNA_START=37 /DNA_END=1491 /DNA_ORIENTATION=-